MVTQKVGCNNFYIGSLNFFLPNSVSNVCIYCFRILSLNLSGLFIHSLMKFFFATSPLTFTLSKNCSVSTNAAFPVAMLYNLFLSAWSNGFIIAHRSITNSVLSLPITQCRKYCDTSLFFFRSSISNNGDVIVVPKKWDPAQRCLAEIE